MVLSLDLRPQGWAGVGGSGVGGGGEGDLWVEEGGEGFEGEGSFIVVVPNESGAIK